MIQVIAWSFICNAFCSGGENWKNWFQLPGLLFFKEFLIWTALQKKGNDMENKVCKFHHIERL